MKSALLLCAWLAAAPAAPPAPKAAPAKSAAKKARDSKPAEAKAEPPARKPFKWDVPGLTAWVDSPGPQVSNGVPLELQVARSTRPVDELIQHFVDEFEAAHFFIPPDEAQASPTRDPMLTALDTERLVAYTVIFQENPDRTTTLIFGTADMTRYNPAQQQVPWAPMMAGAERVMLSETEDAQSVVYAVRAPEKQVLDFYRGELGRAGFVEKESGRFVRGSELLKLFIQRDGEVLMVGLDRRLGVEDAALQRAP